MSISNSRIRTGDTHIEDLLTNVRAQAADISAYTHSEVERFFKVQNPFIPCKLLAAIETFDNPQEGFEIWKRFYESGSKQRLKDDLKSTAIQPRPLRLAVAKNAELRAFNAITPQGQPLNNLLDSALATTPSKGLSTLINPRAAIDEIFRSTRYWARPLPTDRYSLARHLCNISRPEIEKKLVRSLDEIRNAATRPLVDISPDEQQKILRGLTAKRVQFLHRISYQSFAERRSNSRRTLDGIEPEHINPSAQFGFEIEGHLPYALESSDQQENTRAILRMAGLSTASEGELVHNYKKWDVGSDKSVINPLTATGPLVSRRRLNTEPAEKRRGVEVISPILTGVKGAKEAQLALSTLAERLRTNETCGLHVHCDLTGAPLDEVKNLVTAFIKNEECIDQYIHRGRRGNRSNYAASVKNLSLTAVQKAKNFRELAKIVNSTTRYSKLDILGVADPQLPTTVQYRGEGGAGYLDSALPYMVLMVNFTYAARKDPNVTFEEVVEKTLNGAYALEANKTSDQTPSIGH